MHARTHTHTHTHTQTHITTSPKRLSWKHLLITLKCSIETPLMRESLPMPMLPERLLWQITVLPPTVTSPVSKLLITVTSSSSCTCGWNDLKTIFSTPVSGIIMKPAVTSFYPFYFLSSNNAYKPWIALSLGETSSHTKGRRGRVNSTVTEQNKISC